jgi:hypothetical protein
MQKLPVKKRTYVRVFCGIMRTNVPKGGYIHERDSSVVDDK